MLSKSQVVSLLAGERLPRIAGLSEPEVQQLGLNASASEMWLPVDAQPLSPAVLHSGLSARARELWPKFDISPQSLSTNSELMACGSDAIGRALTTEYQSGGRGRRGRSWLSPVARNLATSFVWSSPRPLQELLGLSLVVGVAVADALQSLGVAQTRLKWPNDVVVAVDAERYAKLGGILVELQRVENRSVAVIGIGLNHGCADALSSFVDQALADLHVLAPTVRRSQALVAITNALADYLVAFEERGFLPIVEAFDTLHLFTGREVTMLSGGESQLPLTSGRVLGVTPTGALRLAGAEGVFDVDSGEVSVRPS